MLEQRGTVAPPYAYLFSMISLPGGIGLALGAQGSMIARPMAHSSRVCPKCGGLNGAEERVCYRCGQRLPGPLASGLLDTFYSALGREAPLTRLFLGMCAIEFVLMAVTGKSASLLGGVRISEGLRWGAMPSDVTSALLGLPPVSHAEPWRYLSATFVHFGLLHIVFNGMALWDLGRVVEQRLGSGRFAVIFLGTSIAGFVVSDFWYAPRQEPAFTGGASAGLFGLVGVLVGYLYAARDPAWKQFLTRVVIYAVIFAIAWPVNNAAHIGGALTGLPLGYLFYKEKRPWKRALWFNALAGILVLASFASVALSLRSPYWQRAKQAEIQAGIE